jgi:hypothetical protein
MKLISLSLFAVLATACTDPADPVVVTPDSQVFASLYPGAARQVEAPPFSIDLATCATARHAVPGEAGDQFALAHLGDDGHCQVWLGYDETAPAQIIHTDIYCELDSVGTADVVLAAPESAGGGGCGGPPGDPILSIASEHCVAITQ